MAGDAHPLKKNWQTDWSKCCLCQQDKNESLMSPKSNPALRSDDGYSQLAKNIPRFQSLNQMPMNIDPVSLTETVEDALNITWSSYHVQQKRGQRFEVSLSSLLPLFREQAHSVATIKHAMGSFKEAVGFLNPGQTPVIAVDQPLYALAKQIQWQWPEYGEEEFIIMFGGLHIEMAALRSLGSLLQDSGWTSALTEAKVCSSGTAESFLGASSVTRTRHAHQITACSLYRLMQEAYRDYCAQSVRPHLNFEGWCARRKQESPQFLFWNLVLEMELTTLMLIRSFREGDFTLYCDTLHELLGYFFARWLTVHLYDMMTLQQCHPEVAREFKRGNFVVHKSAREFSAIAIDQAHGQNNAVIKGDGGAIGLTEDPERLRHWMVAGPEVSRLIAGYEVMSGARDATATYKQHEQTQGAQKTFLEKVVTDCSHD